MFKIVSEISYDVFLPSISCIVQTFSGSHGFLSILYTDTRGNTGGGAPGAAGPSGAAGCAAGIAAAPAAAEHCGSAVGRPPRPTPPPPPNPAAPVRDANQPMKRSSEVSLLIVSAIGSGVCCI
jgi:hypothetical protein